MNLDLGSDILKEASGIDDFSKKSSKLDFHVHALEEEMKKIEAFKPIERLKEESRRGGGIAVEEFTLVRNYGEGEGRVNASNDFMEKKNWMSSVQLCTPVSRNQDSVFHLRSRFLIGEGSGRGNQNYQFRKEGGAFWPFEKQPRVNVVKEKQGTAAVDGLTLAVPEAEVASNDWTVKCDYGFAKAKLQQPHEQEQQKKQRRCWSPELHKIFVDALHQLGGAQTATPKQIRELMKVEGLTNDEVKSHLQKYRIHIKRVVEPASSAGPSQFAVSGSPQGPLHGGKAAKGGSAGSVEDDGDDKS
ncbi:hypothetical protein C2S51_031342 [Perilla frutescens var. frutescens]|nr:hypothetical protein C2S51_031342 [Perilla frutescens var. frutescens]